MPYLPLHRRNTTSQYKIPSKRTRESDPSKQDYCNDDNVSYFGKSPRQLLALGAVLDHLCRGGQIADSTRVFLKEANRGRSSLRETPSGLLSCMIACQNPLSLDHGFEDRDDYDVDDGYSIPTAAIRGYKDDEDMTCEVATLDDGETLDLETLAENFAQVERKVDELVADPPNEEDTTPTLSLSGYSFDRERNLHEFLKTDLPKQEDMLSALSLFGYLCDKDDDKASVNSLAKKMQGILNRKSSRLFATSDTRFNGQKAMKVRQRHPGKVASYALSSDDDVLTFAECKEQDIKDTNSAVPSTFTQGSSVLANAANTAWSSTFPISKKQEATCARKEFPETAFSGVHFVPYDNLSCATTIRSRTIVSPTVATGNENIRHGETKLTRVGERMKGTADTVYLPTLIAPSWEACNTVANKQSRSSKQCRNGTGGTRNLFKLVRSLSSKSLQRGKPKTNGILAPLPRNELDGFEVQEVEQTRFEI